MDIEKRDSNTIKFVLKISYTLSLKTDNRRKMRTEYFIPFETFCNIYISFSFLIIF
jgi:hypothetical protein